MKILVISGFLGAGTTTFIQTLAQKTGREYIIMENEYGETGIDGDLLQQDRLKTWELTEGCICCTRKNDFATSVLTIANTLAPEILIIEPSGVGQLGAVLHNLQKIAYACIHILPPVTIVDAHSVAHYLHTFRDIYTDQIRHASYLILSKTERLPSSDIARIATTLRTLNPTAAILATPYENQPTDWWQALLQPAARETVVSAYRSAVYIPDLENIAINGPQVPSLHELLEILVAMLRGYLGEVYRAKGYAPIGGQWTRFDIADKQYRVAQCAAMSADKAIIIGRQLHRSALTAAFSDSPIDT